MKHKLFLATALIISALANSCVREEVISPETEGNLTVTLDLSDAKASMTSNGFVFSAGDVVNWISSTGQNTSYTLKAEDIVGGNTATFKASIPGLSSGNVSGYFACNIGSDNAVNFTKGNYADYQAYLYQTEAGQSNAGYFFLHTGMEYTTLTKGTTSVKLTMQIAGSVIAVKPFMTETKYSAETVRYVRFISEDDIAGTVVYNHSAGTAGEMSGNLAKSCKVYLETPFALSGISSKDLSKPVYFSMPAQTLAAGYQILVGTNKATYTFTAGSATVLDEDTIMTIPVDLSKAVRTTVSQKKLTLTADMVESNYPMEYVSQPVDGDTYGFGSNWDWVNPITEAQATARYNAFGNPANLFDSNNNTSYHTNVDFGALNTSWQARKPYGQEGCVPNTYVQVNLPGQYGALKITVTTQKSGICSNTSEIRTFGDTGMKLLVRTNKSDDFKEYAKYTDKGIKYGSSATLDNISVPGEEIMAIRLQNNATADWTGRSVAFGIAELTVYDKYPTELNPVMVTGVTLSQTTKSIYVGATSNVTATVLPSTATNKSVIWKSSDASVATVSDGVITAKKVGSTTISATTVEGGFVANCSVSVIESSGYPQGVTVVQNAAENYAYALIDFKENPDLCFTVCHHDNGTKLSNHFAEFTTKHPDKGTPIIMTNADIFFKWESYLFSCNVVMSAGQMLRYPAWADGDYYPVRSALGQNADGSFEINWVRGGGTTGPNATTLYKYAAPIKYTDAVAAYNAEGTSKTWWWPTEAIGCSPHMVVDGKNVCKKYYDLECSSFNGGTSDTYKTAKTMYGFRADGVMVILVEWYLTLSQAADRMIELGCVTAVNFDGGGSSEMLGPGGKKLQAQTDASERTIPSAICISVK